METSFPFFHLYLKGKSEQAWGQKWRAMKHWRNIFICKTKSVQVNLHWRECNLRTTVKSSLFPGPGFEWRAVVWQEGRHLPAQAGGTPHLQASSAVWKSIQHSTQPRVSKCAWTSVWGCVYVGGFTYAHGVMLLHLPGRAHYLSPCWKEEEIVSEFLVSSYCSLQIFHILHLHSKYHLLLEHSTVTLTNTNLSLSSYTWSISSNWTFLDFIKYFQKLLFKPFRFILSCPLRWCFMKSELNFTLTLLSKIPYRVEPGSEQNLWSRLIKSLTDRTVHQKAVTSKQRAPIKHTQLLDDKNIHINKAGKHFEVIYGNTSE